MSDDDDLIDPVLEFELVDRPMGEPDPLTMWDQLVDLCETDADLDALFTMWDQAKGRA